MQTGEASQGIRVVVATRLDILMQVVAIRALVYMAEQSCPYAEEFDENDFAGATHLIAYVHGEPAGVLRMRWFADFAKAERLAVRPNWRKGAVSKALIEAGSELAARKGYREILGHIEPALLGFWKRYGDVRELPGRVAVQFSDRTYIEVVKDVIPPVDALTLQTDPMVLLRPEGRWDEPGILDHSARRGAVRSL